MKKSISLILALCMVLMFAACADNGNKTPDGTTPDSTKPENITPEITLQEVYDAGKNLTALLGNHENVYVRVVSNGNLIREEYLSKQYAYSFYSAEFMNLGMEYANFATDCSEYFYIDNIYTFNVTLAPSGMVEMTGILALLGTNSFIAPEVLSDDAASIIEKDGFIIVTCTADMDKVAVMGDDIVSCTETYTIDAETREMTSVKTVYIYEDGTVVEGISTITRDVENPEGMEPFLAYAKETENMRTVTIVSNPGTENEKTESIQVPIGLQVGFSPDFFVEKNFTLYADAACTQTVEEELDVNTDLTVYIKWDE